jgi:hypothetical protein
MAGSVSACLECRSPGDQRLREDGRGPVIPRRAEGRSPLAGPVPGEPGQRAQRIRRRGGEPSWFPGCGRRCRFFDWRQRPENKSAADSMIPP